MKVNLIKEGTIRNFVKRNARSKPSFQSWLDTLREANWQTTHDIKKTFNTTDILGKGSDRVCFDIGGNNYRLICKYLFGSKDIKLFVLWIGTHDEYTILNKKGLQYTAENYKDYE